jgi:hypothetical protein
MMWDKAVSSLVIDGIFHRHAVSIDGIHAPTNHVMARLFWPVFRPNMVDATKLSFPGYKY